ncbi:hypothetical protein BJY52DRAFT_1196263 [Lactarius psammicola]|nr:hypothetical protein BJY52DRAFT_1196263 [Lactarius psammicola]
MCTRMSSLVHYVPAGRQSPTISGRVSGRRTLHGATLQELLRAKNYAILQILHERNELMRERESLRGNDTEFPELDFISPPEDGTITYTVMWSGEESHVLRERVRMPSWVQYPGDRRYSDASTQTEDPDATLADIDPPAQDDNNVTKKRKVID